MFEETMQYLTLKQIFFFNNKTVTPLHPLCLSVAIATRMTKLTCPTTN